MQLYPIESHSWLAIELLDNFNNSFLTPSNKRGSYACRQLLKNMQQQINLAGELVETSFPYYFTASNKQRWYVSFSHSHQHVAVLVSQYPHIGIDVEDRAISEKIATRFFSVDECDWLNSQPLLDQTKLRGLLWRLKECYIKTQQNKDKKLVKELRKNILSELGIEKLTGLANLAKSDDSNNSFHPINFINDNAVLIGNYQTLACSFIIHN